MKLEIGLSQSEQNTTYAPLAVLLAYHKMKGSLKPLKNVDIKMKMRVFSPTDKLIQVLVSILAGCETLSLVNTYLKPEIALANILGYKSFADQSTLSRTLDKLSLMNIEQLRSSSNQIRQTYSQISTHDWRGYLWLDYDLSALPCAARAQESQKGYFSGKKTKLGGN